MEGKVTWRVKYSEFDTIILDSRDLTYRVLYMYNNREARWARIEKFDVYEDALIEATKLRLSGVPVAGVVRWEEPK